MKFADYFKEALAYGESLGLRNGTEEVYADVCFELDEPKALKIKGEKPFYPVVITVYAGSGLSVENISSTLAITPEQQIKLIKIFVSAYEQYLAGKKEPVAADSDR